MKVAVLLTPVATLARVPVPDAGHGSRPLPLLGPMGALAAGRRLGARCRAGKAILRG